MSLAASSGPGKGHVGGGTEALTYITSPGGLAPGNGGSTLINSSSSYATLSACQAYCSSTPGCVAL